MSWCCSVVVCLAEIAPPVLSCLYVGFTFICIMCGCFSITSFQSIFPNDISRCQEIPTVEVFGEKFKEIKKLLFSEENNHVRIIGLYGMGGVGKTTLLKELNNKFIKTSHGFDLVIWVLVSKDLDLKDIQYQIGDKLSLSWPEATDIYKRTNDIFNKRVNLLEIGIPNVRNTTNEKITKSRIVFTTRLESVCGSIGARPIKVEFLDEGETWNLFHQTLDPVIRGLAKDIAKECLILPLALLAIGRSMASKKELKQWKYALSTLRESARRFPDTVDEVLRILKFSYDNLENCKLKSCFLYCLLDEVPDVEKARLEGHDIIGCFKSACLLESCVIKEFGAKEHGMKMHDVIRELEIWIASSELGEINLKDSIQEQLNLDNWSLSTGAPKCVNLSTLQLRGSKIRTLSDEFFQYMPRLKVLSMTPHNLKIDKLPTSMSSLSGLRYLNLSRTTFSSDALKPGIFDLLNWEDEGGPSLHELERLDNLKSLRITIKTDFALKKLVTSVKLQLCTKLLIDFGRGITSISLSLSSPLSPTSVTLAGMANLKLLHIRLCDELEELRIPSTSRVRADDKATLCTSLEVLHVQLMSELNIVCDMLQQSLCLVNLKHVRIMGCHKLKDVTWLIYAQNLETLYLGCQSRLEEIISDRFPGLIDCNITFPRLQTLKLEELKNLQKISNHNVRFTMLKHIRVMDFPGLKKLPFDSGTLRRIEGENEWWESLEWEDETTKSNFAPYFTKLGANFFTY
ncbi:hypothetical protein MKX01_007557 [Papaver californicum]|nr:hypothetical protein MKX01_007557 [Papaver californicum]